MVLKWLSENGLSLDVCGRLWDLVTPRSASRSAVVFARMGPPRSACRVNWPGGTECLAMASLNSAVNRVLLPRLYWISHARRRDLARFDGSRDTASIMFQFCFLAVETKERISAKSIAPCNDRKPPEIF